VVPVVICLVWAGRRSAHRVDCSPQVARSCHARGHVQAAYYLDNCNLAGIENQIFFFIVIEKEPPYLVRCPKLMGEVINVGKQLYQHDLQLYRCFATVTRRPGMQSDQPASYQPFAESTCPFISIGFCDSAKFSLSLARPAFEQRHKDLSPIASSSRLIRQVVGLVLLVNSERLTERHLCSCLAQAVNLLLSMLAQKFR
jgi:hypothetical protein